MSSQKGNAARSRPQKYQNSHAFKNNMHDQTPQIKKINSLQVSKVCARCKEIIEWKIKYKKYKPLKKPRKCTICGQLNVTTTYHIMCFPCCQNKKVCPKCNQPREILLPPPTTDPNDKEIKDILATLSERQRRTFLRKLKKQEESDTPMKAAEILEAMKISQEDDEDLEEDKQDLDEDDNDSVHSSSNDSNN